MLRPENRKTGKSRSVRNFVWVILHGIRTILGSIESELATQCAFENGLNFGKKALHLSPFSNVRRAASSATHEASEPGMTPQKGVKKYYCVGDTQFSKKIGGICSRTLTTRLKDVL